MSWLQIDTSVPGYAGQVVALVTGIARTPSGRAVLEGVRASGGSVEIEKPAPSDPPNATVRRESSAQTPAPEGSGAKPDWHIGFDPQDGRARLIRPRDRRRWSCSCCCGRRSGAPPPGTEADARRVIVEPDPEEEAAIARFQQERNTQ